MTITHVLNLTLYFCVKYILVRYMSQESTMTQQLFQADLTAVENVAISLRKRCNFVGFAELLKLLDSSFLERKFSGEKTTIGRRFLTWAIEEDETDIVASLLQKGVDLAEIHKGQNALHLAANVGSISIMQQFVDVGADPNTLDLRGNTILSSTLKYNTSNKIEVIQWLLRKGSDWSKKNTDGKESIHLASTMSADLVNLFLEAGSDVDVRNDVNGDTPLHVACTRCIPETIVSLLLRGANINSLNFEGETPLVKLLKSVKNVSDFHSRSRRRVASFLIHLGGHLGFLDGSKYVKDTFHRRCVVSYRNITLTNRNVNSLKHLARLTLRTCLVEVKGNNSDMPIPENIKRYLRFMDSQTVDFIIMMITSNSNNTGRL